MIGAQCPARPGSHEFKEQPATSTQGLEHWRTFVCWACHTIVKISLKEKREQSLGEN